MPAEAHFITVVRGKTDRSRYPLTKDSILVGREQSCDICLSSAELSPIHFLLQRAGQGYLIVQKGARPVRINGHDTPQAALTDSDRIEVGPFVLEYHAPEGTASKAAPLPGLARQSSEKQPKKSGKSKSILLLLAVVAYLVLIPLALVLWKMRTQEVARPSLSARLQTLNSATTTSSLDSDLRNRVSALAREALSQEMLVSRETTIRRLRDALQATAVSGSNPYEDPAVMKDPLRAFLQDEIKRQYAEIARAKPKPKGGILPEM